MWRRAECSQQNPALQQVLTTSHNTDYQPCPHWRRFWQRFPRRGRATPGPASRLPHTRPDAALSGQSCCPPTGMECSRHSSLAISVPCNTSQASKVSAPSPGDCNWVQIKLHFSTVPLPETVILKYKLSEYCEALSLQWAETLVSFLLHFSKRMMRGLLRKASWRSNACCIYQCDKPTADTTAFQCIKYHLCSYNLACVQPRQSVHALQTVCSFHRQPIHSFILIKIQMMVDIMQVNACP